MEITPPELAGLPLDTFEPNASTPQVPDTSFRGLRVSVPTEVRVDTGEVPIVPIAGFARLDVPSPPTTEPMWLIAIDEAGAEHRGVISDQDESPREPTPDFGTPDPALLVGMSVDTCFNPDLVRTCALVDPRGAYRVRVEYRGFVSNEEDVVIADLPPPG